MPMIIPLEKTPLGKIIKKEHNFENDSPLSLEEVKGQLKPKPSNKKNKGEFIMGLREFFDPTPSTIIAENIIDVTVSPTIDENVKSE